MKITRLIIKNFLSIEHMEITDIDNTLILVGKNNAGKTSILNAIKLLSGDYEVNAFSFHEPNRPIEVQGTFKLFAEDIDHLYERRLVSKHHKYEKWYDAFKERINMEDDETTVIMKVYPNGDIRVGDPVNRDNPYAAEVVPRLHIVKETRDLEYLDRQLVDIHGFSEMDEVINNTCIFDNTRPCNDCFDCIGYINKKKPVELSLQETFKLVNYKLYSTNLKKYASSINKFFRDNYGKQYEIYYKFDFDIESLLRIRTIVKNNHLDFEKNLDQVNLSMISIYILSLFQAYIEVEGVMHNLIIIEQPELHLHPEFQKIASEIIYRLSKKNQVIFTTHSPHMLYNFSTKQIKQIAIDYETQNTVLGSADSIDQVLDDLGYSANDMINADFVFIVEGKDDRSRLPMILDKYYSEIRDEDGDLNRIAIIPTNSCTNIKTYANLKFINRGFLKNNFLMIRDSDGHNPEALVKELCRYYYRRIKDDDAKIPRIKPENVLVLKYYSIENYFLNPRIMMALEVIETEESFYEILYDRYVQYLHKLKSTRRFIAKTGIHIGSVEDVKKYIEEIKIHIRGHNLFDIFYHKYYRKSDQHEIIKRYIDIAPREEFEDILGRIDRFIFFENRKK